MQVRALPGALALLVISNTKVEGAEGVELIQYLRKRLPDLPIIYLANVGRSTPEIEAQLPPNVPILREPFEKEELLAAVARLLDGKGSAQTHPGAAARAGRGP